jgi:uncharacterized protein (DUF1684 family)
MSSISLTLVRDHGEGEWRPSLRRMSSLSLLEWRRQVGRLYDDIRGTVDIRAAHELWRTTRNDLLKHHPESPIPEERRAAFEGVPVAPYDAAMRFEASIDADVEPLRLEIATGTDGVVPFERVGRAHLDGVGDLDVWWIATYGGGIFVPVKDGLAGIRTYGGGRYVIDTVKGADLGGTGDELVVDFNFAYNPSCAYDPAWSCPLAPQGNVVSAAIEAGELTT